MKSLYFKSKIFIRKKINLLHLLQIIISAKKYNQSNLILLEYKARTKLLTKEVKSKRKYSTRAATKKDRFLCKKR